jgi:hypothetical protein
VTADPARLARANAQIQAILAERLLARLDAPARRASTQAVLRDVAEHRLDPYAAADALLREAGEERRDGH